MIKNIDTCAWFREEGENYFRRSLFLHGFGSDEEYPRPTDATTAKRFAHLAGYYRKIVNGFGTNVDWEWGDGQEEAFRLVNKALITKPLLLYPDFSIPFRVATDASRPDWEPA
ncbi:Mary1-like Reverse transcriptase [Phytophthora megakarya]|uniref:Mary1-like Reverse transcriptase n=1 Tax=Phytophthora megakarya TaxID=4795 RepID=A0A225WAB6_9STRA|nr:Mary1-like Reverse transcriptase [Phytophthora megakarya]